MAFYFSVIYILFLSILHVKLDAPIAKVIFGLREPLPSSRGLGWIAGFFTFFPLRYFVPEHIQILALAYCIIGMIWGFIYYDYIAKKEDEAD